MFILLFVTAILYRFTISSLGHPRRMWVGISSYSPSFCPKTEGIVTELLLRCFTQDIRVHGQSSVSGHKFYKEQKLP